MWIKDEIINLWRAKSNSQRWVKCITYRGYFYGKYIKKKKNVWFNLLHSNNYTSTYSLVSHRFVDAFFFCYTLIRMNLALRWRTFICTNCLCMVLLYTQQVNNIRIANNRIFFLVSIQYNTIQWKFLFSYRS